MASVAFRPGIIHAAAPRHGDKADGVIAAINDQRGTVTEIEELLFIDVAVVIGSLPQDCRNRLGNGVNVGLLNGETVRLLLAVVKSHEEGVFPSGGADNCGRELGSAAVRQGNDEPNVQAGLAVIETGLIDGHGQGSAQAHHELVAGEPFFRIEAAHFLCLFLLLFVVENETAGVLAYPPGGAGLVLV